jgi:hypothetical protein
VLYFELVRKDKDREVSIDVVAVDGNDRVVRKYSQKVPPTSVGKISLGLPLKDIGPGAFRLRVLASDGNINATNETAIMIK